jgi:hypothetical protein
MACVPTETDAEFSDSYRRNLERGDATHAPFLETLDLRALPLAAPRAP